MSEYRIENGGFNIIGPNGRLFRCRREYDASAALLELQKLESEIFNLKTAAAKHNEQVVNIKQVSQPTYTMDSELSAALSTAKAENEAMRKLLGEAHATITKIGICRRCKGKGTYIPHCSMCDDSTFDHICDDDPRPCFDCAGTGGNGNSVEIAARIAAILTPTPESGKEKK